MADDRMYTQANWKVKPGNEDRFLKTWDKMKAALAEEGRGPLWGSLIQNVEDPKHYISFALWPDHQAIERLRATPETADLLAEMVALCSEGGPGTYREVFHVERAAAEA